MALSQLVKDVEHKLCSLLPGAGNYEFKQTMQDFSKHQKNLLRPITKYSNHSWLIYSLSDSFHLSSNRSFFRSAVLVWNFAIGHVLLRACLPSCHCSSLPCVNIWSITFKSWSREPIWIVASIRLLNSLMKIVENQFFVCWDKFHILASLFLKVYRFFKINNVAASVRF